MAATDPKVHYTQPETVEFYRAAAVEIGLWRSEERLVLATFPREAVLLNAGCGAGRGSLGLWELGYTQVLGVDFSRPMIEAARLLAAKLEYATPFRVGDLTRLGFDAGAFDGILWLANGIADLPDDAARELALRGLRRVTRAGGKAIIATPVDWDLDAFTARLASSGWQVASTSRREEKESEPPEVTARFPADVRFWVLSAR